MQKCSIWPSSHWSSGVIHANSNFWPSAWVWTNRDIISIFISIITNIWQWRATARRRRINNLIDYSLFVAIYWTDGGTFMQVWWASSFCMVSCKNELWPFHMVVKCSKGTQLHFTAAKPHWLMCKFHLFGAQQSTGRSNYCHYHAEMARRIFASFSAIVHLRAHLYQ